MSEVMTPQEEAVIEARIMERIEAARRGDREAALWLMKTIEVYAREHPDRVVRYLAELEADWLRVLQ